MQTREQSQCDLFFFPVLCLKLFAKREQGHFYEHFKKKLHIKAIEAFRVVKRENMVNLSSGHLLNLP